VDCVASRLPARRDLFPPAATSGEITVTQATGALVTFQSCRSAGTSRYPSPPRS